MLHDTDGHNFLTGVSTGEHKAVHESLNNGALNFSELLLLPSASGMGNDDLGLRVLNCDVVFETDVIDLSIDNIDGKSSIP